VQASFVTDYGEASRYEVASKGSYVMVAAAVDTHSGNRIAIKKINAVFKSTSPTPPASYARSSCSCIVMPL
jgi:mitogen-activated protein kinase 1/3